MKRCDDQPRDEITHRIMRMRQRGNMCALMHILHNKCSTSIMKRRARRATFAATFAKSAISPIRDPLIFRNEIRNIKSGAVIPCYLTADMTVDGHPLGQCHFSLLNHCSFMINPPAPAPIRIIEIIEMVLSSIERATSRYQRESTTSEAWISAVSKIAWEIKPAGNYDAVSTADRAITRGQALSCVSRERERVRETERGREGNRWNIIST